MTVANNSEKEDDPVPLWIPRVITGGKEPPSEYECWLERLPVGTVFIAGYMTHYHGDLYELLWKGSKYYLLHQEGMYERDLYVLPHRFSNEHLEYEILGHNPPKEEEQENGNEE